MKVCLAGAFGNFGKEIFKKLIKAWQKVIACNVKKNYNFEQNRY